MELTFDPLARRIAIFYPADFICKTKTLLTYIWKANNLWTCRLASDEMSNRWEERGYKLVLDFIKTDDNEDIEPLALAVVKEIIEAYPDNMDSRKNSLETVRQIVKKPPYNPEVFPCYPIFDSNGKPSGYEHLALKYLRFSKDIESVQTTASIEKAKLSELKIQHLGLDVETEKSVLSALEKLGVSLAEFIQKSCKFRARTVIGRIKKYSDSDLSVVLTKDLLDVENKCYQTHPKKIAELTRRAIKAIMTHNDNCTETNQKWFLSATAINRLTGSRINSIKEVLKDYESMVEAHNNKHELKPLTNRGNGRRDIDICLLVPCGVGNLLSE